MLTPLDRGGSLHLPQRGHGDRAQGKEHAVSGQLRSLAQRR